MASWTGFKDAEWLIGWLGKHFDAVARLELWAEQFEPSEEEEPAEPAALPEEQLADARMEIGRLLAGTAAEADAVAGRLASFGLVQFCFFLGNRRGP